MDTRKPLINFNRLVDLGEILYGNDDIQDEFEATYFNPVTLTIPK
jgi:hypothetical protein